MASISWVKSLGRWRVRWRATNRRTHRVFSGSQVFIDKAQAVRVYAEMEAQEKAWRNGEVESIDSIAEAAKDFESHCKQHTLRTQQHYKSVMGRFLKSLPASTLRIQQIDTRCIQEYLYRLRDAGNINRTLNAHLTVIKAFCRYCADRYNMPNPASKVAMMRQDPPDIRFISPDEFHRLLDVAGPGLWQDRILFLAHTGLRASEFCGLVKANRLIPNATAVTVIGKGRRKRTVPLNRTCREILSRTYIRRPVGRMRLYNKIAQLAKRARIDRAGPHALRHYCATQMLLRGVPIAKVAEVLGHSIRVCETTYKHFIPTDLQGTTDVLD